MKRQFILLLFGVMVAFPLSGQDTLTLQECYRLSRANEPVQETKSMHKKQTALELKNIQSNYFPQLNLSAKATYQSEAIEVELDLPQPMGSKTMSSDQDQYDITMDVNQVIWDGGVTSARKKLEKKSRDAALQDIDVQLYQLREQVNSSYFMLLLFRRQEELFTETLEVLRSKYRSTKSAVENGVLLPGSEEILNAEILKTEQKLAQIRAGMESTLKILRDLTGTSIPGDVQCVAPEPDISEDMNVERPENEYFSLQRSKIKSLNSLETAKRMPKISAFGRLGYGKPGLNMLSNTFDPYWIAGIQLSWTPFDWNNASRNKQKYAIRQKMLQKQEASFNKKMRIKSRQLRADIEQYRTALNKDGEIVKSRGKVTDIYSSRLKNGAITPAEYLEQLNAEKNAKITREIHKIQLLQAKINYLNVLGQYKTTHNAQSQKTESNENN